MALSSGMEWLSSLGAAWLPVLVDATVKGTVILIVASVVSLLVRRASAATRHLVWFLALVGLLGLPALSVALPGWQVLPGWLGVGQTASLDAQGAAAPTAAAEPAVPPAADSPPWAAGHSAGRPEASPSRPRPLGAASGTPLAPAAEASQPWSAINLWIWILPLWAAGAALSLAPVAIGLVSLRRLRRTSRRVADGPWAVLLERLSAELGLKRRVILLRSSRRSMPMAWGLVRPILLIPDEAEGWSSECLRAVLLHEMAHIKRWDCLTQLVARVACGLYWFNPLAWVALRRMVAEHERACDDVVLAAGGRAPEYAEHLLKVASRLPAVRLSMGVGIALARPSRLEGRLLAILDGKRSRRAVTRAAALGSILALAALLMPLAVMRPMVQAEQAAAVAAAGSSNAADEVAWSEALNGLRVRLTAPSGTVYRRRATLPLFVEVQNVGDKPIPFSRFSPQVRILAADAKGARMGIPGSPELTPWEGRTDSLAPSDTVHWTVWFDRLRFVKPVERGSSLDLKVSAPTQLVEPGKLPKEVYSAPVTIQIKDEFPSLLSETDLAGEWTGATDLTFWEGMGLRGHRAMHIDGQGRVTMLSGMGKNSDGLMPPGRTEVILDKQRLDRLAKLLRDQQVWKLAAVKSNIAYPDEEEIRLSLANGGTSLVGDYPWHVAKDQPSLMALRTEMHALVADVVAAARKQSEGSGERPGEVEAGPRTGRLTPDEEKERDRLLAEADQRLREALIALGEEFPQLKAVHHWNLVAGQSSPGSMIVHLATVTEESKARGGVDVAEGERFSLSVNVVPADRVHKQQLKVGILYRNLGLFGMARARADDPKLDAALKKLLDDSLAPLMALDEQVGKGRPAVPAAEVEPLPGSGTPLEKALAEGYAFVALCEAADEAALTDKVTGVHEYATCYQTLTVVEVLAGQKPADGVKGFHYTPFLWRGEQAVNKGQRVVWIVRQVEERFRGIKALEDTPENRKAIAEATGVAIKPPVPPAAPPKESGAAPATPKTGRPVHPGPDWTEGFSSPPHIYC
jgi:beta-lactamase regulating signal transducer with metallopeptidase domain